MKWAKLPANQATTRPQTIATPHVTVTASALGIHLGAVLDWSSKRILLQQAIPFLPDRLGHATARCAPVDPQALNARVLGALDPLEV
jgi:hypothetical protein